MPAVLLVCQHSDPLYEDTHGGNLYPSRLTWKDLLEQLSVTVYALKKKDRALVSFRKYIPLYI